MRTHVALLTSLCLLSACAASAHRSTTVDPLSTATEDVVPAATAVDASTIAMSAVDAGVALAPRSGTVTEQRVMRAASAGGWETVAPMSAVGSRNGLSAHLRVLARRRIAAMDPEERREALEWHRERVSGRSRRMRAGGGAARRSEGGDAGFGSLGAAAVQTSTAPRSPASNTITNNQVANVDEGDIVKASGDDLIILRRGNLFRVSLANNSARRVGHAPAYPPGTPPGDWYDELLVDGDIALVLGYSYRANATEVNRFRLERNGAIRYLDSFYVRSDDYYSSENYATRLVNGRFVVYVPVGLLGEDPWDSRFRLPSVRVGRTGAFREPFDFSHVFATSANAGAGTLHTVLHCDVHSARVSCSAQGVLGGGARTFFVSNSAVYVWTEPDDDGTQDTSPTQTRQTGSWIVRLPLNQARAPGAARVRGGPVDQFAFDERGDALHVILRNDGHGDAMWQGLATEGAVAALKIPLSRMSGSVSDAPAQSYTMLVNMARGGAFKQRWIGDWALFGSGRSVYGHDIQAGMRAQFFAYRASDHRLFEVQTSHGIERIEPLGSHALAVGNEGNTLALTPVSLDGAAPSAQPSLRLAGQAQGETRSHGFFFRPSGPRDGLFGIATSASHQTGTRQLRSASDVSFFRVEQLSLSSIGTVEARAADLAARCSVSCADWYGNTRPIFWGSRVFALMGDELVEADLTQRTLIERTRVDYGDGVRTVVPEEDQESNDEF